MQNLAIDIGNSAIKAGFAGKKLISQSCRSVYYSKNNFSKDFSALLKLLINNYHISGIKKIGVSLVNDSLKEKCQRIIKHKFFKDPVFINQDIKLPIRIKYSKTLGTDRICSAVAAYKLYSSENILVIDFGTATTFNIISGGIFSGGIISPGIETSLNSLIKNTALPYPSSVKKFRLLSKDTDSAILSGVFLSVKFTTEGIINTLRKKYKNLTVVATGGLSSKVSGLVNGINYFDKNLVLEGINIILTYNESFQE